MPSKKYGAPFKAHWEKAHTRTHLTTKLIKQMISTFYAESEIKSFKIIDGGCANIHVLIHLNTSDKPVIMRVYLREPESLYKEKKIAELLKNKLPVPQFFHVAKAGGYTFAIIEYLPGLPLRELLLSNSKNQKIEHIMFKVGQTLGTISEITFPQSGFFDKNLKIEQRITQNTLVEFCHSTLQHPKVQSTLSATEIEQITTLLRVYKNFLPDGAEKHLVHADFDPSNILVQEKNSTLEISGILDWEFSFSGSTLCDVASMLRYAHHMPEDYQNGFLKGLVSSGYELPNFWHLTIQLLNLISLLDCLQRSDPDSRPHQVADIKSLIQHILSSLKK